MEQLKQLLTAAGIAYKENEPLAAHCTFKIGGPARLFVQPADRAQLCRAVALCKAQGVRHYLLGNGSNILFADEGYNGAVLDISSMQDTVEVHGSQLTAGAGVRLSALCKTALEHGLTGLEFAYGIPGTVGGAVYMNAGAYGGEMKDVLTTVQYRTAFPGQEWLCLLRPCSNWYISAAIPPGRGGAPAYGVFQGGRQPAGAGGAFHGRARLPQQRADRSCPAAAGRTENTL